MKKILFSGLLVGFGAAVSAAPTTLALSEDGTSLVVTVPAGNMPGCKLELAYDNSVGTACKFASANRAVDRSDWTAAQTLVDAVPAEGAVYTVPLADLGVPADACFRLFATGSFAVLDYAWIAAANAYVDTGIPDTEVYGLEISLLPTSCVGNYGFAFGSAAGSSAGVSLQHGGAYTKAYFSRWTNNAYTYGAVFSFNQSQANTIVFRGNRLLFNGSNWSATAGAKTWVTRPVGLSGKNLNLGCLAGAGSATGCAKWYAVKFYGADGDLKLDYVPVKKGDAVGFFDRATGAFVTPTGGGTLTAGTVTAEAGTTALAVGRLYSFPRAAVAPAAVTLDKTDGAKLTIAVRPGYGTGSALYLASGAADGGDDLAAWSERLEVTASIPSEGGTYTVDLVEKGLAAGKLFRVFAGGTYTPLERVKFDSAGDAIDTGVRDYFCHAIAFDHCPLGYTSQYVGILGTQDGNGGRPGFRICHGGSVAKMCITQRRDTLYTYKFVAISTTARNTFCASDDAMSYNGTAFTPESGAPVWTTSPAGTSGYNMFLGRIAAEAAAAASYGWVYALTLRDAENRLLLDYQPVLSASGTAGFFDRACGRFVTSTDGGALVAGDATGAATPMGLSLCETMTADETLPVTAMWHGGATSGDLGDAANWACTNAFGAAIAEAVPQAGVTRVVFAGDLAFNFATTDAVRWLAAEFHDCTLAADCDWRGLGAITATGTIDLHGHTLTLAAPPTGGTLTNTDTATLSNLYFNVPEDASVENTAAAISGNIRFVKEGAGTFVATYYPQTYTGGNDIVEGTVRVGVPGTMDRINKKSYFGSTMTLDVESAGTLDLNGTFYWGYHTINLHGGTILNSRAPSTFFFNPYINLTADSFFEAAVGCDLKANMSLAGHTLTCRIHDGCWFWLNGASSTAGKIVTTGNGILNTESSSARDWSNLSLDIGGKFNQACTSVTVADLTVRCPAGGLSAVSNYLLKVNGRFTPVTQNFPNVQLQNGATLDISASTLPWSAASSVEGCTLSFADNASVTVDTGTQSFTQPQVVAWDEDAPPAGSTKLTAVSTRPRVSLTVADDGIYAVSGLMIIIR